MTPEQFDAVMGALDGIQTAVYTVGFTGFVLLMVLSLERSRRRK